MNDEPIKKETFRGPLGPTDPGPYLAFRLLCEATKECKFSEKKENAYGTGITIHAPQNLQQWLTSFGETDPSSVADKVGNGEIKQRAQAVLDAVKDGRSDKLLSAIEQFLNTGDS